MRSINPDAYVGPTEESNWVIYGRLLVGAYPSSVHDDANTRILTGILKLGITTFVCLQQEYQHEGVKEHEWRSGLKLRPYIFDAIKLVDSLPPSSFPGGAKPDGLEFVHFPIVDCSIANEASVLQLAYDLVGRMLRGENMYIREYWLRHRRLSPSRVRPCDSATPLWPSVILCDTCGNIMSHAVLPGFSSILDFVLSYLQIAGAVTGEQAPSFP